jgi:DNA-binding HxlR family transcriptional regulator
MTQEGSFFIPAASADLADLLHTHSCREIAATLSLVGDKWTVLVIAFLAGRPRRFNELRRLIGAITQRMLTLTLRQLEREGLVSRTVFPANPPHVEYALTDLGRSLGEPLQYLGIWVLNNQGALAAARERFDQQQKARS